MKVEGRIFAFFAVFYFIVASAYYYLSRDAIGTTGLALAGVLGAMVAFYLLFTSRRVFPRPEDRNDADIDEADPEYGFFSPHSWWPFMIGLGAFVIAIGLVFAVWMLVFGVALLVLALVGWLFEYYRGAFAS